MSGGDQSINFVLILLPFSKHICHCLPMYPRLTAKLEKFHQIREELSVNDRLPEVEHVSLVGGRFEEPEILAGLGLPVPTRIEERNLTGEDESMVLHTLYTLAILGFPISPEVKIDNVNLNYAMRDFLAETHPTNVAIFARIFYNIEELQSAEPLAYRIQCLHMPEEAQSRRALNRDAWLERIQQSGAFAVTAYGDKNCGDLDLKTALTVNGLGDDDKPFKVAATCQESIIRCMDYIPMSMAIAAHMISYLNENLPYACDLVNDRHPHHKKISSLLDPYSFLSEVCMPVTHPPCAGPR